MKLPKKLLSIMVCALGLMLSCDNDTASIGTVIMPSQDSLSTYHETFPILTRSVATGPVVANTSSCHLGSVIDPETRALTTSSFLAQLHLQEDYVLPPKSQLLLDEDGKVIVDSCILRIFHDKFYGDSLTTMKLTVTDLRFDNIMEEDQTFYTDIDPEAYVNPNPMVKATTTYSILDQNLSDEETSLSSGNYRIIPINLGSEYGSYVLNSYFDHPEYFKNSYTFIHKVCPGFYVEHAGGVGSMVNADVSAMDIYFRYQNAQNTTTKAWMRMGATEEVIQSTRYEHKLPAEMLNADNPYTYIKSPAGIHTEVELPIRQIAAGTHYKDTLNSARFTLRRYAREITGGQALSAPSHLLLVRKGHVDEFFAANKLPDSETSFLCAFSTSENAYTFQNIAPLITYIRKQRDNESGVLPNDSDAERAKKWAAWEEKNPDWQTFVLIPVKADYTTTQSIYGTSQVLVGVNNDYNLTSVKLEGSRNGEVELNVIYSRFAQ